MIKNRDGTPYRLSRPNHIMMKQDLWDGENVILHNLNYEEFPLKTEKKEEVKEMISEEMKEVKEKSLTAYCLPIELEETVDPVYNEKKITMKYGNKFSFELAMVSRGDIKCEFWTNSVKIREKSIIYMPWEKRWWKVESVSDDVYSCYPSDQTPSF